MDPKEMELIEKYSAEDNELKNLWEEHKLYEKQLDKFESKPFLTPQEELQKRELKKQKLEGKTLLVAKLNKLKKMDG